MKGGEKYIKDLEPAGLGKIVRMLLTVSLSILQIPFILEGWISYFLNSIIKFLSAIFFPIALVSFAW